MNYNNNKIITLDNEYDLYKKHIISKSSNHDFDFNNLKKIIKFVL